VQSVIGGGWTRLIVVQVLCLLQGVVCLFVYLCGYYLVVSETV